MTIFQQLHQTAPESKGRGDCYYANLKESSLAWKIMLVLSRIELTSSIFKAPNLTRQISILLFSAKKLLHTIINKKKKEKKLNQMFSPVWVTFHAALKVEMCRLNCNDYRFFPPMAKTIIVTRNIGSKGKKSCQTEAVWSSLDKTLINYLNWDWFVSKLWQDQLRQTTFTGEVGPVASPRRTHAITGYYVVTMGTHSRRRSTRNRLFLAIGRGLTLPTSTVRLEMFSSIQSTIDSLVYRWWQRDFWTEHFFGLGPTDYLL